MNERFATKRLVRSSVVRYVITGFMNCLSKKFLITAASPSQVFYSSKEIGKEDKITKSKAEHMYT
jgi:hypothetical protein